MLKRFRKTFKLKVIVKLNIKINTTRNTVSKKVYKFKGFESKQRGIKKCLKNDGEIMFVK